MNQPYEKGPGSTAVAKYYEEIGSKKSTTYIDAYCFTGSMDEEFECTNFEQRSEYAAYTTVEEKGFAEKGSIEFSHFSQFRENRLLLKTFGFLSSSFQAGSENPLTAVASMQQIQINLILA